MNTTSGMPRSYNPAGFTLIELLVVITVLAILAAMLLPTLSRGVSVSKRISCVNRLRQWDMAMADYSHDNQDCIPRESFFPGGTQWNLWSQVRSPLAVDVWYNALPPLLKEYPAFYYAPSALRREFYTHSRFAQCPCAVFDPNSHKDVAYFSIAMNSKLILQPNSAIKFSSILRPVNTVTFLDNRLDKERCVHPRQPEDQLGQPSAFASRFVTRHLGRGTLAFADGHVDTMKGDDVVAEGYAFYPQTSIVWTADPQTDPNIVE